MFDSGYPPKEEQNGDGGQGQNGTLNFPLYISVLFEFSCSQ